MSTTTGRRSPSTHYTRCLAGKRLTDMTQVRRRRQPPTSPTRETVRTYRAASVGTPFTPTAHRRPQLSETRHPRPVVAPARRGLTCLVASAPTTASVARRAACARSCVGFRALLPRLLRPPPHDSFFGRQPHAWPGPLRRERSPGGGIGKLHTPPVATRTLSTHGRAWGGMGRPAVGPACPALHRAGPAAGAYEPLTGP